jgi:hypothetical protein
MIEELKALAEKARLAKANGFSAELGALACLGGHVNSNLPAILSALEAVPVMKEALEQITDDNSCFGSWECWEVARQALAALEGK